MTKVSGVFGAVFGVIFIILLYFLNRVKLIDLESFVEEIDREYQKD